MQVGTIESIFRYPLKSAGGESPDTIDLGLAGIPGRKGPSFPASKPNRGSLEVDPVSLAILEDPSGF